MSESRQPVVILACPVLRELIEARIAGSGTPSRYLDYGLHVLPKRMAPSLQEELHRLAEPSLVLVGYGLCGNGLEGLRAGRHTLVIPRVDDCIAILLGSREAYLEAQRRHPGTYYLTRGWLEVGAHPLGEYREMVEKFGRESADHVLDMLFGNYTRLCLLASTSADLDACRDEAHRVAEFCASRWNMSYEERIGSDALLRALLDAPRRMAALGEDFVVVPPGGCVQARMFARA